MRPARRPDVLYIMVCVNVGVGISTNVIPFRIPTVENTCNPGFLLKAPI